MTTKHTLHTDAGHGWLAVPRAELASLGLLHQISHYSYQRGATVYLEEDCDLSLYVQTIEAKGGKFECTSAPQANYSRIRGYDSFRAAPSEIAQFPTCPSSHAQCRLPSTSKTERTS